MQDAAQPKPCMFEITEEEISRVVARFYACVRADDVLGPVFTAAVQDWPTHEAKICAFWRGAILRTPGYQGNPMRIHLANSAILPEHFSQWLTLFSRVVERELKPQTAAAFMALADRIGHGLSSGIANFRKPEGTPPILG